MTRREVKRIGGVTVSLPDQFYEQLTLAGNCSVDPEAAKRHLYNMTVSAIREAKKNVNRFGICSTADVLVAVNLDESRRLLLDAGFYVLRGEYRDAEASG